MLSPTQHTNYKPKTLILLGYSCIIALVLLFSFLESGTSRKFNEIEEKLDTIIFDYMKIQNSPSLKKTEFPSIRHSFEELLHSDDVELIFSMAATENPLVLREYSELERDQRDFKDRLRSFDILLEEGRTAISRSISILFISQVILAAILTVIYALYEMKNYRSFLKKKNSRLLERKLIEALETDRNRLSMELHDDMGQKLAMIKQYFSAKENKNGQEIILDKFTGDIIQKIRLLYQELRSGETYSVHFREQLEILISDFTSLTGIPIDTEFNGLTTLQITKETRQHIYRIIQELLSNSRKHSGATGISLRINHIYPTLKIIYSDNGRGLGLQVEQNPAGLGQKSLDYRLKILKADKKLLTVKKEGGFGIQLSIPLQNCEKGEN